MKTICFHSFLLGFLFILATCVKALFEYVFFIFLLPFLCLAVHFLINKNTKALIKSLVFIFIMLFTAESFIFSYKLMNLKFNGKFAFSDRGPWAFYANTYKRMNELTPLRFQTYLATIPGEGVCRSLFNAEDCFYWSSETDSGIGAKKREQLTGQGVTREKIDGAFLSSAKQEILKNPPLYLFFVFLESFKMFFWESTQVGYVIYPAGLSQLFKLAFFKNILRLLAFMLTFASFFYLMRTIISRWKLLWDFDSRESEKIQNLFFTAVLILGVVGMNALFLVLTRFSFPVAPLYLISIAYFLNTIFYRKTF